MKTEVLVYLGIFDNDEEQATKLIVEYMETLLPFYPQMSLDISRISKQEKSVWVGSFIEVTEWGKEDVIYGRIEIVEKYLNCPRPIEISIYCPEPSFIALNIGLEDYLISRLIKSDGSPQGAVHLWDLISDNAIDRKILRYWHEGMTGPMIADHLGYRTQTVYNKLTSLRRKYGPKVVPSRSKLAKVSK